MEKFLLNRFNILYLAPFILGSLTVFSFQPFNFTFINFIILPLFFYLLIFIKKKSKNVYRKKPFKGNLFIFGTTFGFGFFLSGLHWITNSLTFDDNFKILIPFGLVLIPLFLSLFFSIITVFFGGILNLNFRSIFLLSAALAFSDFLRSNILTGFPWNLWAYSVSWSAEIIQILEKLGLFAFNLLSITIFMMPSVIFLKIENYKKFLVLIFTSLIILFLYIYGNQSINKNKEFLKTVDQKFNIKVISPNFELEYGLTDEQIDKRFEKLIRYSEPTNNSKTLFIWPEGVFSGYSYDEIFLLQEKFSRNFKESHYILFGINRADEKQQGFYNSMIIVNNRLEIIKEYKKQKLVPFGEFLPFEKKLNKFGIKKITEGYGSFLKGKNQKNLVIDNLNILPLICYEIIFTNFIKYSDENTNLIINISEDGWFGDSIGPNQHFAKAIFRAVEQNSFLIRSANQGISAIIDNKGIIVKRLNSKEAGVIEYEVPLIKSKRKNKNHLIFFALLITYIFIFYNYKKNNG